MGYPTSTYRYCNYEEENFATSRQTLKMLVSLFENGIIQSVNLGRNFRMKSPSFTLFRLYIFIFGWYFLVLHVPLWNRHNERRLLRFGFDIPENLGNFQNPVRNKATVDAPWVCYIHAHYFLIAIGVSVHQWNYRCSGLLYRIDVGLRRCSLRQDRQS